MSKPYTIIIAGSRNFNDKEYMNRHFGRFITELAREDLNRDFRVIHGGCPTGADALAEEVAWMWGLWDVEEYPADWEQHGKAAGPIRNRQMAEDADALIAFLYGESRGTKNMIDEAFKRGLRVQVVYCE